MSLMSLEDYRSAVLNGEWSAVSLMLERMSSEQRKYTHLPLFQLIVNHQNDRLAEVLRRYSSDINVNGMTKRGLPLILRAYGVANIRAVDLLLASGADPFVLDYKAHGVLEFAKKCGVQEVLKHAEILLNVRLAMRTMQPQTA